MRKTNKEIESWLREKRWKKELKCRRGNHAYTGDINFNDTITFRHQRLVDQVILSKCNSPLYDYLVQSNFIGKPSNRIKIERSFSIENDVDSYPLHEPHLVYKKIAMDLCCYGI